MWAADDASRQNTSGLWLVLLTLIQCISCWPSSELHTPTVRARKHLLDAGGKGDIVAAPEAQDQRLGRGDHNTGVGHCEAIQALLDAPGCFAVQIIHPNLQQMGR